MAALSLGEITLKDADTGNNLVRFDTNPTVYRPFDLPIRGSTFPTLDGGDIKQVFGVHPRDLVLTLDGQIPTPECFASLHAKYRQPTQVMQLDDWFGNRFNVIFTPGVISFQPTPIQGSCVGAVSYTMSLTCCAILQWMGGSF